VADGAGGRADPRDGGRQLAQQRLLANPHHVQSLAALAWAYERRRDAALQREACRQLVRRAEDVALAPDAAELLAARRTLEVAA
jgi:hypothetical protein